jgi:hypothetical protein
LFTEEIKRYGQRTLCEVLSQINVGLLTTLPKACCVAMHSSYYYLSIFVHFLILYYVGSILCALSTKEGKRLLGPVSSLPPSRVLDIFSGSGDQRPPRTRSDGRGEIWGRGERKTDQARRKPTQTDTTCTLPHRNAVHTTKEEGELHQRASLVAQPEVAATAHGALCSEMEQPDHRRHPW